MLLNTAWVFLLLDHLSLLRSISQDLRQSAVEICILYLLFCCCYLQWAMEAWAAEAGPRTGNKTLLISSQKFIINMLDVEAAVVKVTDDTALSLGASAPSILPLSSNSSSLHWAAPSREKKGRTSPPKLISSSYLFTEASSHTFISPVLIFWSQLP